MSDAKVLLFDIENTPNVSYTWGKYEQDVLAFKQEWWILCFGYKWLGEKNTHVVAQPDFTSYGPNNRSDDREVVQALRDLIDEADVVVAHNGDRFDLPKARARWIKHGIVPPSPVKSIDTLTIARRLFRFNSSRLGDLGEHLGIGRKASDGGISTWLRCMEGDDEAWNTMIHYCHQDVALLEKLYLRMLPWIDRHPNLAAISAMSDGCPRCGIRGMLQRRGSVTTTTMTYQRYQCQACKGWTRSRLSEKDIEKPEQVPAI